MLRQAESQAVRARSRKNRGSDRKESGVFSAHCILATLFARCIGKILLKATIDNDDCMRELERNVIMRLYNASCMTVLWNKESKQTFTNAECNSSPFMYHLRGTNNQECSYEHLTPVALNYLYLLAYFNYSKACVLCLINPLIIHA